MGTSLTAEEIEANIRHLAWDFTWWGVLTGTTLNFVLVFVVRLGAPGILVAAVTYGPALVSIFWQIPATRLMRRRGNLYRWAVVTGGIERIVYVALALLPFLARVGLAELTVLLMMAQAFAMTLAGTSFLGVMIDAVPASRAAHMMSWRMVGYGVSTTASTLLAGLLLGWLPFPLNYQVLFGIGFMASLISLWHVAQIRVPERQGTALAGIWWHELRPVFRRPAFLRFVGISGVIQVALGMVAPLLPIFAVRRLGASDVQISLILTTYCATSVLGSLFAQRTMRRISRELMLACTALGYGIYPLLLSVSRGVDWLIPWAAIGGFFYAAFSVTCYDAVVAATPDADRTNYMAIYNLEYNAGLFLGPLLAALLIQAPGGPALGLQTAAAVCVMVVVLCAVRRQPVAQ